MYRGTSLIRNCLLIGPYSRPLRRALRWSQGQTVKDSLEQSCGKYSPYPQMPATHAEHDQGTLRGLADYKFPTMSNSDSARSNLRQDQRRSRSKSVHVMIRRSYRFIQWKLRQVLAKPLNACHSQRYNSQFKNNYLAEMWSGSEEGSFFMLIDCCSTQLYARE